MPLVQVMIAIIPLTVLLFGGISVADFVLAWMVVGILTVPMILVKAVMLYWLYKKNTLVPLIKSNLLMLGLGVPLAWIVMFIFSTMLNNYLNIVKVAEILRNQIQSFSFSQSLNMGEEIIIFAFTLILYAHLGWLLDYKAISRRIEPTEDFQNMLFLSNLLFFGLPIIIEILK